MAGRKECQEAQVRDEVVYGAVEWVERLAGWGARGTPFAALRTAYALHQHHL